MSDNFVFDQEQRYYIAWTCYKKCINSFEEKPLNPYERDCL